MYHHSGCAKSKEGRCDCDCRGSHHGVRKGNFANKAKKRLTDLITTSVPDLANKPRAKRTREIRDTLAEGASSWLAEKVSGDTKGDVIDDLAEAISDTLAESDASWRIGEKHLLCEIFTQMYFCRALIDKAVADGLAKLAETFAEIVAAGLDDTLPNASTTRSKFIKVLSDKLTEELGKRLMNVVLAQVAYPTPEQLVMLIILFCPNPTPEGHPAAAEAVTKTGILMIVAAAAAKP